MINKKDYKKLSPFKGWALENFPFIEEDFDAITEYQLYCKIVEYLNKVIYNEILLEQSNNELVNAFNELKEYVDNYFNNLDVQEEIDNKLNEMASDGTLTRLIKKYIDPFIQQQNLVIEAQNSEIENFKNAIGQEITIMQDQINDIPGGTPIPVSSTSDMTDDSKIYLNLTDGYWYYYNGASWVQGGVYQATKLPDNSITANKYKKIEIVSTNRFDMSTAKNGYIGSNGVIHDGETSSGGLGVYSDFIEVPNGIEEVYIYPEHNIIFYDNSKTYISGTTTTVAGSTDLPNGTKYIRTCTYPAKLGDLQVNFQHGKAPRDEYKVIISPSASESDLKFLNNELKPEYMNSYKIVGYNLFNKNTCVSGVISTVDGKLIDSSSNWTEPMSSDFIEVEAETSYKKGNVYKVRVVYYDLNKDMLSYNANDHSAILTPENCKYIRLTTEIENLDKLTCIKDDEEVGNGYFPFNYTLEGLVVEDYSKNHETDFNFPVETNTINNDTFINRHKVNDYVTIEDDSYIPTKNIVLNKELNHADTTRNDYYIRTNKKIIEVSFEFKSIGENNNVLRFEFFDKNKSSIGNYYPKLNFKLNDTEWTYRKLRSIIPRGTEYVRLAFVSYVDSGLYLRYVSASLLDEAIISGTNNLKFIGHQGMPLFAPKNTLPSFEYAVISKMDSCVINVNWTSDGEVVVLHDDTIDATSDGTGNIHEMTYEQALQYDFGSYFSPYYTGTKIPTLDEVLGLFSQGGIKPTIRWNDGTPVQIREKIFNLFKKHGIEDKVTIIGFTLSNLEELHELYPNFRYGLCCYEVSSDIINRVKNLGKNAFIDYSTVPTKEIVDEVHSAGLDIECWFINSIDNLETVYANGVDGIKTDIYVLQNCYFK